MLSRFCAAWIILLVLSPAAAPFSVGGARQIVGVHLNTQRPARGKDDYEAWLMQGVDLGVEPTTPMATTIAAMSTSNAVGIDASTNAGPALAVPHAPLADKADARILVLRV